MKTWRATITDTHIAVSQGGKEKRFIRNTDSMQLIDRLIMSGQLELKNITTEEAPQ